MHRPFTPIPVWLDTTRRIDIEHSSRFPEPESIEFLLASFETLYCLGMTDRQVVELTVVLGCLERRNLFHIPLTEPSSPITVLPDSWYLNNSRFFLACPTLEQKIQRWVEMFLPRNDLRSASAQTFWSESSKNWQGFFLGELDGSEFDRLVQKTKNRFAQRFLGLPDTGVWDQRSQEVLKKVQAGVPKALLPWKNGTLDGFSYRFLARAWKRKHGFVA